MQTAQHPFARNRLVVLDKLHLLTKGGFEMLMAPSFRKNATVIAELARTNHHGPVQRTGLNFKRMVHGQLPDTMLKRAMKLLMVVIKLNTGVKSDNTSLASCGRGST